MKTKIFTLLLAIATGIGSMFASNTEVNGIWYNFNSNTKTATVTYRGSSYDSYSNEYSGDVVIPESVTYNGITYSVTSIGIVAFGACTSLTSVTIPNSVTSIGSSAFYNCNGLTSVTIPNSVTSIGDGAFKYCSGLTSVTIPESVTSIGDGAFYECTGLTKVNIMDIAAWCNIAFNLSSNPLYYAEHLYVNDEEVTELVIPNSVTSIGSYAFYNCSGLTSVTIPESVASIGYYAFYNCSGLTSVTIGNSVTNIGECAFYQCSSLTSVTIPNSVTSIGINAFYAVPNIVYSGSATGSPWGALSVNGYVDGYLVYSDESKTTLLACFRSAQGEITIPNSVTSIGNRAFYGCSGLTSVTIPESVTSIGNRAFYGCSGLTSVNITDIAAWCNIAFSGSSSNPLYYAKHLYVNDVEVTDLVIPESVTSIGDYAFSCCSSLTSVTIPGSVTNIGECAFYQCSGLTSVTIPYNVTSIGGSAFYAVPNIVYSGSATGSPWGALSVNGYVDGYLVYSDESKTTLLACFRSAQGEITIPNSVTSIGNRAFYGCSGLTSVTIPNSITSIGQYAFYNCSGLTSVTIPNSVTKIGYDAFYAVLNIVYSGSATGSPWGALSVNGYVDGYLVYSNQSKNTLRACLRSVQGEITIPNSVTSIGNRAFYGCSGLTSVTIPESVTSIGSQAFDGCSSLTSVNITDIAAWCNIAFSGSSSNPLYYAKHLYVNDVEVTDLVIPESVTSIGSYAFYNCSGLTSVTIPYNVTSIGGSAFSGCTSLNSIVWNAKNCPDFAPNNTPFYANYYNNSNHIYFDLRPQITSFTFGSDVEHIPANLLEGMSNLPFINLSNTIAWAEQNFSKTNSLLNSMTLYLNGQEIKKLTISDGVTSIGAYTFINCAKMTELTIPSSVTTIGEGAFMNENRLQKITLGENIETIANSAFANCPYLLEIHARMEFPPVIDASVFADCGDLSGIVCYVPEDSYAFYKKTAVWKEFNLIVEQEPEPTAINPVSDDKPAQMNKILRNGQIFILRGDKTYTLQGQEVK